MHVRLTATTVECFVNHQRVASHLRAERRGSWSTRREHLPPHHQAIHNGWSTASFLTQAERIGPHTRTLVETILHAAAIPEQHFARCRGLLRLAQEFGPTVLEAAAQRALHAEVQTVKAVKILCTAETTAAPADATRPGHVNTRGATYYAEPPTTGLEPQGE